MIIALFLLLFSLVAVSYENVLCFMVINLINISKFCLPKLCCPYL